MFKHIAGGSLFVVYQFAGCCSVLAQTNTQVVPSIPAIQKKINQILESPTETIGPEKLAELKAVAGGTVADIVPQLLVFQMEHRSDERKLWGSEALLGKLWPDITPSALVVATSPYLQTQDRSLKNKLRHILDAAFISNDVVSFSSIVPLIRQRGGELPRPFVEYMFHASPSVTFQTLANTLEGDTKRRGELITEARPVYELLDERKSSVAKDKPIEPKTVDQLEILSRNGNWWTRCFVALSLEQCRAFRRKDIIDRLKDDNDPLVRRILASLPALIASDSTVSPGPDSRMTIKRVELHIPFASDSTALNVESYPQLNEIVELLRKNPQYIARIESHTDKTKKSNASYSKKLTERRAQAVLDYIAKSGKIDVQRMTSIGLGFAQPKAPNDSDSGNAENRRIVVSIYEGP